MFTYSCAGPSHEKSPAIARRCSSRQRTWSRSAAIARSAAGDIFLADTDNHRIRRIDPAGMVSTVAGTGQLGTVAQPGPFACSITGGNTLHCDVGDLAAGASFSVSVQTTEPIALGSPLCGETLDNTAFADADNADQVDDDASIDVVCGAIEVHKFAKVPASEDTRPVQGAGFTLFDNGTAIDPPGEVTTGADGIACFDGLPINTQFRLSETTVPAGYAPVDDRLVTSSADNADCEGAGDPTQVEVENLALTDISWTVASQVPGGTLTQVDCWFGEIDGAPDFSTTVESGSHTFPDLLPTDPDVTLTCQFVVDP